MKETFFGLLHRPFQATCRPEGYYPTETMEATRASLGQMIETGEGIGLLIGANGLGKTMLLQTMKQEWSDRYETILLSGNSSNLTRAEFFQSMLYELELPFRGLNEGELRLSLVDYLRHQVKREGLLLLVDDAHNFAPALLEEMRILADISGEKGTHVRLILAGTSRLEENLTHASLNHLLQRIVARGYLEPFSKDETEGYLAHAIERAGGELHEVFTPEAIEAIDRHTEGVVRVVQQLTSRAMQLADQHSVCPIDKKMVTLAWAELQQLPATWEEEETAETSATSTVDSVIEFGSLEGETFEKEEPEAEVVEEQESEEIEEVRESDLEIEGETTSVACEIQVERERPKPLIDSIESNNLLPSWETHFEEEEVLMDNYASLKDNLVTPPVPLVETTEVVETIVEETVVETVVEEVSIEEEVVETSEIEKALLEKVEATQTEPVTEEPVAEEVFDEEEEISSEEATIDDAVAEPIAPIVFEEEQSEAVEEIVEEQEIIDEDSTRFSPEEAAVYETEEAHGEDFEEEEEAFDPDEFDSELVHETFEQAAETLEQEDDFDEVIALVDHFTTHLESEADAEFHEKETEVVMHQSKVIVQEEITFETEPTSESSEEVETEKHVIHALEEDADEVAAAIARQDSSICEGSCLEVVHNEEVAESSEEEAFPAEPAAEESEERPLIVLEEEVEEAPQTLEYPTVSPVRKDDYRSLFAKLRHG
ncbi:Hypothetical protein PBC10988_32950 [Planctomycetales bacterium 10988]|nr:Hypothetical protein PBC10988_32950 [Planctomycetales bacterium 10988]